MADINPEEFVDHYKIWEVEPQRSGPTALFYGLVDQFHTAKDKLEGQPVWLDWIANHVRKDGKPEDLKDLHFTGWTLTLKGNVKAPGKVEIHNQFTDGKWVTWELEGPSRLLAPAGKSYDLDQRPEIPAGLDHYLCYPVKEAAFDRQVKLEDQFDEKIGQPEDIDKLEPKYLGVPVDKADHETPQKPKYNRKHELVHLAIYALHPQRVVTDPPIIVHVNDQFRATRPLPVKQSLYVAVPSLKRPFKG
jgi:hypothetical protein